MPCGAGVTPRLVLQAVDVPHGSYDLNGDGVAAEMPARACFLAPDAAAAWAPMADLVVVSDMWRSPDSSKAAVAAGRGAAAPGFSGHNYGLSIDIDVQKTKKRLGLTLKAELDVWMNAHGWWCWREDHAEPKWSPKPNEAWHYNFAPNGVKYEDGHCVRWLQLEIRRRYPVPDLRPIDDEQHDLAELGLYHGRIDGKAGPLTTQARIAFLASWGCPRQLYARTLWFVAEARRHTSWRASLARGRR